MPSPYADLQRPPLDPRALTAALTPPRGWWREVRVVAEAESTNALVADAARRGEPEGLVVVAEAQTGGRGRLGRAWVAPPRAGLTFSLLWRPGAVPAARWGWLPLLAGVAVADALARHAEVDARVKWPNDVLVAGAKCAGILTEVVGEGVVVGIGLNVTTRREELPVPEATSLALAGAAVTDRDTVVRAVLRRLAERYLSWRDAGGDPGASGVRAQYRGACATVGAQVRVALPGGETLRGVAQDVDADGRLVVDGVAVGAGDVVHVRPAQEPA